MPCAHILGARIRRRREMQHNIRQPCDARQAFAIIQIARKRNDTQGAQAVALRMIPCQCIGAISLAD